VTEAEEYKLLRETSAEVREAVEKAYNELIALIRAGTPPRDAVAQVMATFNGQYAAILAAGLGVVLSESVSVESALALQVGTIQLSTKLYANTQAVSSVVEGVVRNHVEGFVDARKLALDLFEGYGFNPTEPLDISLDNLALPKHLRDALLRDTATRRELARAYARAKTRALKTDALRAAYLELLDAINATEKGVGADYLDKKLWVAFNEKARYLANRIAQTELARAIADRRAKEFMLDSDLEYVQWRMSPTHPEYDICDYFAGLDSYGLGKGVYPKALAPNPPAHPHCRCRLSVRLDLTGKTIADKPNAQETYFDSLSPVRQRMVAGTAAKLERVKAGESAWDVHNTKTSPTYQVKPVGAVR
jgi:hypothetical protein